MVQKRTGNGIAYCYGAGFSYETAVTFLEKLKLSTPYSHIISLPKQCEIAVRVKNGIQYIFILNYEQNHTYVEIKSKLNDLLTGEPYEGKVKIKGYGVMILEKRA